MKKDSEYLKKIFIYVIIKMGTYEIIVKWRYEIWQNL